MRNPYQGPTHIISRASSKTVLYVLCHFIGQWRFREVTGTHSHQEDLVVTLVDTADQPQMFICTT